MGPQSRGQSRAIAMCVASAWYASETSVGAACEPPEIRAPLEAPLPAKLRGSHF
jgi:hypothetical protein